MKKIHITESQWRAILESEFAYPLDVKSDGGKSECFTQGEVAVNNIDQDAPNDVTISDTVKRSKEGWFGMNRYPAMHRLPESKELDNIKNSGYGAKNNSYIKNTASSEGGKMVSNISGEINSNKDGSRNNTNQVRIYRMENYKKNDPALFAKNGGEETLRILKTQTNKNAKSNAAKHSSDVKTRNTNQVDTLNNENNGVYYFK